jgi:hypothetical protein
MKQGWARGGGRQNRAGPFRRRWLSPLRGLGDGWTPTLGLTPQATLFRPPRRADRQYP